MIKRNKNTYYKTIIGLKSGREIKVRLQGECITELEKQIENRTVRVICITMPPTSKSPQYHAYILTEQIETLQIGNDLYD